MTNPAWAALITRIPATDDLPVTLLLRLIETSAADLNARTGNDLANTLSPQERARCRTASALAHTQPGLKDAAGHNARSQPLHLPPQSPTDRHLSPQKPDAHGSPQRKGGVGPPTPSKDLKQTKLALIALLALRGR